MYQWYSGERYRAVMALLLFKKILLLKKMVPFFQLYNKSFIMKV